MKKYYDIVDYYKDLADKTIPLCNRFRDEMSREIIIDEADEVLMEHIHEEYLRQYDLDSVCKALRISPDVIRDTSCLTDMITTCECTINKETGKYNNGELVIQIHPKTKIALNYYDDNVRVYTNGTVMVLTKEFKDQIFDNFYSLGKFIDMLMVMGIKTEKLLDMNANGKSNSKAYKKLFEEQQELKQNFSNGKFELDKKTTKANIWDIADCYTLSFRKALDKVLVEEKMIPKHGEIPDKKLASTINSQIRDRIEENVYNREVNQILS